MRNLKRALSLALASIMLLGMMVTGAGAASSSSFTDYDSIVNQEAVEVTSGLGIFDGYTDGSFGPENVVTRAEMAVIICKILNGSSVDPSNFSGISHFTDVPAWAEGYVNFCASMGIVVGVGEGKFNPNGTVTTVEATTMLLKALGYFQDDEDQLGLDWKTTVTGRATYLSLYGSLTLSANEGLTRDNVAELVFHTIQAQRVAYDDNRHLYVNNRNRNEVVTNGTKDWENTFGENTFDMWIVDGVVTANSYTLDSLSETVNNAPRTNVQFYDAQTITGYVNDYPAQAYQGNPVNNGYPFEYTTGLDMIGHAARVYYKIERNAPVVFAIVDRATKVEYISYNSNTTNLANAANEAGFRRNTILEIGQDNWKVNYSWDHTVGTLDDKVAATWGDGEVRLDGPSVNKTLLLISNSSDDKVDVVIVLDQYLDTVRRVTELNDGKTEYRLTTHDGDDQNIAHGTFAVNDYVVVTDIGNQGKMLNFTAPEKVTASISKITGVSDGSGTVKKITADGTEYAGSPVAHHEDSRQELDAYHSLENTTNFEDIQTIGETTLLLDFQGKCIGIAEEETVTNYAYAAQFGVTHNNGSLNLNTQYAITVKLYFIDGTSGVYRVNTTDGSYNTFKGLVTSEHGSELYARAVAKLLNDGFKQGANWGGGQSYPYENQVGTERNGAGYDPKDTYANIVVGTGATSGPLSGTVKGQLYLNWGGTEDDTTTGLGIYKVSVRSDNSVVMTALEYDETAAVNQNGTRLITGHSTFVKANGENAVQSAAHGGRNMYQTSKTVYFYVDGSFTADDLSVGVKTGINNAVSITAGSDKDGNRVNESFEQVFVTCKNHNNHPNNERDTVEAVMVYGYDMGSDNTLYFYKEGNYHLEEQAASRASGLVSITYDLYDADGEVHSVTYNNGGKYYEIDVARQMVNDKNTGYYEIGSDNLESKFVVDRRSDDNQRKFNVLLTDAPGAGGNANTGTVGSLNGAKNVYILNATALHNEFEDNIFTQIDAVGGISGKTLVVDTTGNNIDSVRTIADKCDAGNTVRVSYTYKTDGDNAYQVKVIFVTDYQPKGAKPPVTPGATLDRVTWNPGTGLTVNYHNNDFPIDASYIKNWVETNFGQTVKTVNTLNNMIVFENGGMPMVYTTNRFFKVTNGTTDKYGYYDGNTTSIAAGTLDLVSGGKYLLNNKVGTAVTESSGLALTSLGTNLDAIGEDVTFYRAYTVTTTNVDTVMLGSTTVNNGEAVAEGEKITVTKDGANKKITATVGAENVSGPSPLDVVVEGNVSFSVEDGYVLKAGDNVLRVTYGTVGNEEILNPGESVVVPDGTRYNVVLKTGTANWYYLDADGELAKNGSIAGVSSVATISAADVAVEPGTLIQLASGLEAVLKNVKQDATTGTTLKYVDANAIVEKKDATVIGTYFKNGTSYIPATGGTVKYSDLTVADATDGVVAATDLVQNVKVTVTVPTGWTAGAITAGEYIALAASQTVTLTAVGGDTITPTAGNDVATPTITSSTGIPDPATNIAVTTKTFAEGTKTANFTFTVDGSKVTGDLTIAISAIALSH